MSINTRVFKEKQDELESEFREQSLKYDKLVKLVILKMHYNIIMGFAHNSESIPRFSNVSKGLVRDGHVEEDTMQHIVMGFGPK